MDPITDSAPTAEDNLEKMLRKVSALLAQADHPNTGPAEADTFRAKAEALMYRYRIDEAMLAQAPGVGTKAEHPVWHSFNICRFTSEFDNHYRLMAQSACHHVGVRYVQRTETVYDDQTGNGETYYVAECVGYASDHRIVEVLFLSMSMAFQQRLEPKYDSSLSEATNAYIMRSAGMEGWRIAKAIYNDDAKSLRVKVRKLFKEEAIARGEDPTVLLGKGNSVKAFREDYAGGFVATMRSRLRNMRASRGENETGLVLAGRLETVNEAFYERYPQYRPAAPEAGPYRAPNFGCKKCAKAKSGYCREHGWLRPRYRKVGRSLNAAAYDRGSDAARTVDLGSGGGHRIDRNQAAGEL